MECRDYWVATDGNDSGPGDFKQPFRTIDRAKIAVREDKRRGKCQIAVNIRGGVYRLSHPVVFIPEDSGSAEGEVVYRSAKGEKAIISGAVKVEGWTLHDPTLNIWKAELGIHRGIMPRQLYVNGQRATRARTADYPNYYTPTSTGYTYQYNGGTDPQFPPNWKKPELVEAVTATQWKMMRCPVAEVINGNEVVMQQPCWNNCNVFPSPWNFHLLSWLENAYEFLSEPGQWFLDPDDEVLYYIPRVGEDIQTADVELPIIDALIIGQGTITHPISYLRFEGLEFHYATWFGPNTADGYAADQSGYHLVGSAHVPDVIGHAQHVVPTPGNVTFTFGQNITFANNAFAHFGAVALAFRTGSQNNQIVNNTFYDISSAAIQLSNVEQENHHPDFPSQVTQDNLISYNLIEYTGREYYDASAIFIGFAARTRVEHNDIKHTSWSGIAIGWGWGLLDPGGYAGLVNGTPYAWGIFTTPTVARENKILNNNIEFFLEKLWDGGAIYSTGFQGTSMEDGLLIAGNVAQFKRPLAGGNIFYTDGGSRYVTLLDNVSLNNPQGYLDFGPCGKSSSFPILCLSTDIVPYGADFGGCLTYGDILFERNYTRTFIFYDICTNIYFPNYPVNMVFTLNTQTLSSSDVPAIILNNAGRSDGM